jgi:hypothetical protein
LYNLAQQQTLAKDGTLDSKQAIDDQIIGHPRESFRDCRERYGPPSRIDFVPDLAYR